MKITWTIQLSHMFPCVSKHRVTKGFRKHPIYKYKIWIWYNISNTLTENIFLRNISHILILTKTRNKLTSLNKKSYKLKKEIKKMPFAENWCWHTFWGSFSRVGTNQEKVSFVPNCQFKTNINQHLYSISTCACILLWCPLSNSRLSEDILKATYLKKNCFIYGKSDRYTQFNKSNILLESILKEKKQRVNLFLDLSSNLLAMLRNSLPNKEEMVVPWVSTCS